jgi:hypothetical protein
MRATENPPVEKPYATRLTGIIDLPGFKAALLEVNYSVTNELHESRGGQLVVLTNYVSVHTNYLFLTEGRPNLEHLLDTNLKEVVFEVSQINSETGEVRAREDGREVVYAFESQDGRNANVRLQGARWQDVLKLLGVCLDRTVLCHPALEQSAISMAAFARDKMDAAVDLEMALKEKGISTLPDGDKFELVVPNELAKSATKVQSRPTWLRTQRMTSCRGGSFNGRTRTCRKCSSFMENSSGASWQNRTGWQEALFSL